MDNDTGTISGDPDRELAAMGAVVAALAPLDPAERQRVLDWASKRFNLAISQSARRESRVESSGDAANGETGDYETFAEMFEAAGPTTAHDKVLIAAYWVHSVEGKAQFASFDANRLLKDIGEQIPAVNKAFAVLQKRRPALVVQVKKTGSARQGRKTLKLTAPGVRAAEKMLAGGDGTVDE